MRNKINYCILKFEFDCPLVREAKATDLRRAIANLYPEKQLLHQHRKDGKVNYSYPLVQYKIINGEPILIGFKEGAELLVNLDLLEKIILLENQRHEIISTKLEFYHISIEITDHLQQYQFLTPWLALNEKNYEKYTKFGTWEKKKTLLGKILIGNIISMSKSLGYTVPEPIKVNILKFKEVKTSLKGVPMLGFLGRFSVNFEIPDYFGLGKSVSRGFGTIKRVKELESSEVRGLKTQRSRK